MSGIGLTDRQWAFICPFLPLPDPTGGNVYVALTSRNDVLQAFPKLTACSERA